MLMNKAMIFLVLVTNVMLVVSDTKGKNFYIFCYDCRHAIY